MVKKRKCFIILVAVGAMVCIATMLFVLSVHMSSNLYIFADIDECELLASSNQEEGVFTNYTNALSDRHIRQLSYVSFFAGEFSGKTISFQIFAYEFADELSAKTYFENATGKNSGKLSQNFSLASGLLESQIVIFDGTRAYSAYFPTRSLSEVLRILENCFTVKVK